MAVSATLRFASAGNPAAFLAKNLLDIYTVLSFDYTIERSVDKTGRPSSTATMTTLNVKIRGIKQKRTPFHEWISKPDELKNGNITIYDSTGIISSTVQGLTGTDDIVDVSELFDYPIDMAGDSMDIDMEDATKYHKSSLYDEVSHKDLISFASSKGVTLTATDSDDDIRAKLDMMDETKAMTQAKLEEYCNTNSVTVTPSGGASTPSIDDYRKAVYDDKAKKYKDKKDNEDKKDKQANNAMKHLQDAGDNYKSKTTGVVKSTASDLSKRILEDARCITFENAYCVSLKEHFENNPDSQGELDDSYPWIIELGIRPQSITVQGEAFIGSETKFTFF